MPAEELVETIGAAHETIEGERKQVTVMFVDIVGSMDLAEALDSERWRGVLDRFFALASDSVHSVGGTIDKFTGDGMMALFGAPISYEDHARRACLAALELHASLAPACGSARQRGSAVRGPSGVELGGGDRGGDRRRRSDGLHRDRPYGQSGRADAVAGSGGLHRAERGHRLSGGRRV
jgi:adenylate cyclase